MKKIFTLTAICALLFSASVTAQDFPSDPGTLMVDLELIAADFSSGDTIANQAPEGSGAYASGTTLTITAKTIQGYTFEKWSDEVTDASRQITLTESMSLTALYTHNSYSILFKNDNGETLSEGNYFYGDEVTVPDTPVKDATDEFTYTFIGWNPQVGPVTGPQTYIAVWDTTTNRYPVTFFDWDGETVLYADTLAYGTMPQYKGQTPTRETTEGTIYTWSGWDPELHAVTKGENNYTATYTDMLLEFEVTIVYDKDTTIQTISWGEEIELNAQDNTDRHFVQWQDGLVENPRNVTIISDTTFVAEYADSYVNVAVAANQWTFFCLPQLMIADGWNEDMLVTSDLAGVAWGTYNGAVRAEARSGWETPEMFNALQGYIIYSTKAGNLRLNVYAENLMKEAITVPLETYEAEHAQNANWNFIGNPYNTELSAAAITAQGLTDASATIWNGTGYTNELLSSQNLTFQPLQAFFIQTDGEGSLSFSGAQSPAPARTAQVEENSRIDIEATAGGYTDKTRVIFRSNSSLKYEAGRDASKFMTATAPVQMYFLDVDNIQCAQMVRPAGNDAMRLGYMIRTAGEMEINMPVYAEDYELYDALTDRSYNLSETVSIYSEAGTYNNRLSLRPIKRVPTAVDNAVAGSTTTKLMLNGQLYIVRDGKMFTVQGTQAK